MTPSPMEHLAQGIAPFPVAAPRHVEVDDDPPTVTQVIRLRPPTRAEAPAPLDDEVVEATRRGERWAWEAAYQAYAKALTGFLVLRLRDRDDVAEALSETFLRALDRAATFRGDANSFRAWLFRIARNVSNDRRRPSPVARLDQFQLDLRQS